MIQNLCNIFRSYTVCRASVVFILFLLLFSCRPIVNYPEEPQINFTRVEIHDSTDVLDNPIKKVELTFHLIDGNGDFGLDSTFLSGPFHPDSAFHYNLFIQEYHPEEDSLQKITSPGGLKRYRIPNLTPEGQNKTLIANVTITIEYPFSQMNPLPYDTLQYQFYVYDRAFNRSNIDTSSLIIFH